jgi:uncharacterized membrane protein SirB2
MSLLAFFQWCEQSGIGDAIRNSIWLFPFIEAFHLVGLGVTAGAVLVVDLRLLGVGLRDHPVSQLAKDAEPWLMGSLTMMIASGIPLFLSEATKCYYSFAFWVKMTSLLLVIVFTFTVRRRVVMAETSTQPISGKLAALVSLMLWFGVAWGGRWIGFS